jgi:hypothetical protein
MRKPNREQINQPEDAEAIAILESGEQLPRAGGPWP